MKNRDSSLVWRLTALILGGAGLVLLCVVGVSHFAQRKLIFEQQRAHSEALTLAAVNHIETHIARTETAVQGTAIAWSMLPNKAASTTELIAQVLRAHPQLTGMAIALPASEVQADFKILHGFRKAGEVLVLERSQPDYARQEDWFYLPYELKRPVWSEPYFDHLAQISMVTYSVPVIREGRVVAVVTGGLPLQWLRQMLSQLPLGAGSSAVLLSKQGMFISHQDPRVEMRESVFSLAESLQNPEAIAELKDLGWHMLRDAPGQRFYHRPIGGQSAYINHRPVASIGWSMGVIVPEKQMLAALSRLTRISVLVGCFGLVLLLLASVAVAFSLATPLRRLAVAARHLANGEFDTPLPEIKRSDEVGRLTESFAQMRTDLRAYIEQLTTTTAAKEKIASELAIAHQIQLGIVPKLFPPFPHRGDLDLFACLEPAREVGGDLYDFAILDEDQLYVAIGDVSGKGVPASLLMAVGKTLLKSSIQATKDPARALSLVNDELSENNDTCMFITAFCGILNLRSGQLIYSNAGQNPPLILRKDGSIESLRTRPGPALAAMSGSRYKNFVCTLAGAETLLLYTDGVTEAMNPQNVMFEEQGLMDMASRQRECSMRQLIERIVAAVHSHAAGAEQSDDITLLALRVANYPDAQSSSVGKSPEAEIALKNQREELPRLVAWIEQIGETNQWPGPVLTNLNLALEEWFVNIVSYAYADEAEHTIQLRLWLDTDLVRLEIEDDGRPFDPTQHTPPDTSASLEKREIGGLGIHFLRRVTTGLFYRRVHERNVLTLTLRTKAS